MSYEFTTVTPETHRRVLQRQPQKITLHDVFGWSREFYLEDLSQKFIRLLEAAQGIIAVGDRYRVNARFSTINNHLFIHSSFPTDDSHSIFFGPDTYRFVQFLKNFGVSGRRVVDVGAGSGAGVICIASQFDEVVFSDINPRALESAKINCESANISLSKLQFIESRGLSRVSRMFD